jgi:hypothetical protein
MCPAVFRRLTCSAGLAVFFAGHASAQVPDLVHIPLTRVDGLEQGIGNGITFEWGEMKKAMAATHVVLPDPLPPGARSFRPFRPFRFFARPSADGGPPQVFYIGWKLEMSGAFVRDGTEYSVSISGPTADLTFTDDDAKMPAFLTLKRKQDALRVNAVSGTEDLVIGGKRYRLVHVHDNGELVEFEELRTPVKGNHSRSGFLP